MSIAASGRTVRAASALLALCAGVCLATAVPVRAQMVNPDSGDSSRRPFSALFGGAADQPRGNQSLVFTAAAFGGYDDDIFARGQNPNVGTPRVAGTFVGGQASLAYNRRFAASAFTASTASAVRYLTDTGELVPTFASGSMGYNASLNSRTNLSLHQSLAYRPFYSPVVFPPTSTIGPSLGSAIEGAGPEDPGVGPPDDFTLASDRDGIRYSANGQLSRRLTPRSQLEFRGMYGRADFGGQALDGVSNNRWLAGVNYNYDITRDLGARLGYNYRTFGTQAGGTQVAHDVNVGLVFNKPLVLKRGQTVFSFTPGTTMLLRERLSDDTGGDRFRVRVIGTANLTHTFTADWQGGLDYVHYVGFMDGFAEPVEGDRFGASVGGLITRALDFSMSAGYMTGAIGMQERNFDTTLGSARLRLALHTRVALFAQYFYYHYSYKSGVADQLLAAPELERQGFRAGLNFWLPLIR